MLDFRFDSPKPKVIAGAKGDWELVFVNNGSTDNSVEIALSYAEKAIDQSLTQSVRALARQVKPIGSGLLIDFPRAAQDVLEQDPDDRISYTVSSPPGQFLLGFFQLFGNAAKLGVFIN